MSTPIILKDPLLLVGNNYIGGEWVPSVSGKSFKVFDPATGAEIGSCPESTTTDVDDAIRAAAAAFPPWRSRSGRERSRILRRWYELLIENKDDLATLIIYENGKAHADAVGEVLFAASFLEWFSEEAARQYGDVIPHSSSDFRVAVVKEPVGVCGLITPWNFPAAMVTRKLGPALASGCTVVIKTAGETPFTANAVAILGERAGIPKGVVNIVTALNNTPQIGEVLCTSPIVRKISFTGSTRVGRILMRQSGDTIKKLSLELGGNAPFIIFDDADVDLALRCLITAKFKSSGQTCVCANRIYLQKGIHDRILERLIKAVGEFKVGASHDAANTHGPLITPAAVDKIAKLVDNAKQRGAKVVVGGKQLSDIGPNFYAPTILTSVNPSMRLANEEIFGPVAAIYQYDTEDQVVDAANLCDVGLAAYVFTQDVNRIARVTELIQTGMVAVNSGVVSDAPIPFGGFKQSGLGREGSKYGIEDYLQTKTVVLGNVSVQHRSHL